MSDAPQAHGDARAAPDGGAEAGGEKAAAASQTYEQAAARVEEIIRRLDSGDASLNETLALVREGKALIEQCARQLDEVSDGLEQLRLDELVSRLEGQARD